MLKFCNPQYWNKYQGLYISRGGGQIKTAFLDTQQDELFNLEDDSWWFQYRSSVIVWTLKRFFQKDSLTLDIGGGNGYTTYQAKKAGFRVCLIEPSAAACINALNRGVADVYCGIVDEESIFDESIEQIMVLDVLEHIECDDDFIKCLEKKMVLGGKILITVPAFMCLWSSEDESSGHFRRYKMRELEELMGNRGFRVIYSNYFFEFLFLPILFVRVWMENLGFIKRFEDRNSEEKETITNKQFKIKSGFVDVIIKFFQKIERRRLKKTGAVKFGSSIVIVAVKEN